MHIDWVHFTPWSALAGGLLIGLAAAWLLLIDGRVLGASGILAGLLAPRRGDCHLASGLAFSDWSFRHSWPLCCSGPSATAFQRRDPDADRRRVAGRFRDRLGKGCTSGHGVCGLARLSPRSAVATAAFMASGFLTVFITRHLLSLRQKMAILSPLIVGLIFGLGLCLSGMIDPRKVLAFLDLAGDWDPSLALVMGGRRDGRFCRLSRLPDVDARASRGGRSRFPTTTKIDAKLLGGALIFGVGWGLVGLCPAPAIVQYWLSRWRALCCSCSPWPPA